MGNFIEYTGGAVSSQQVSIRYKFPYKYQNNLLYCVFPLFMNLICLSVEDILQVLILFCVESLESDAILLYSERHALLRVLPVLVVLAMSTEKDGDAIFKKIKVVRLLNIFKVIYFLSYTLLESMECLYLYPLPNS